MADEAVYGISKRGEKTLIYRGFEFWQHRTKADGHIIWRCNKNRVCKCKATIEASGIQVVGTRVVEHNHEGNVATALARRAVGKMKAAVLNTLSNPSTVRAAVSSQLPDHVLMALPKRSSVSRVLRRHRQKALASGDNENALPPSPADMNFLIPDVFKNFALFDSGPGTDRIIVLGCREMLDGLARATTWLADGTFKVLPSLFFQLYSIHFQFVQGINPAGIYCLLLNKSRTTYDRLLLAIHHLIPSANPDTILTDFETAAMGAFTARFPSARITGCYFHLGQSVIRKVNELGLKTLYETDDAFRGNVRCLAALSHVPVEDVAEAFEILADDITTSIPAVEHIDELLSYFEHTYVRGRRIRGRGERYGPAIFHPDSWNQRNGAVDGIARTTNIVEGWHHGLQVLFQCSHPTMWRFIRGLESDCAQQRASFMQGITGIIQPSVRKYQRLRERVTRAVGTYGQTHVLTYLRAIAHLSYV